MREGVAPPSICSRLFTEAEAPVSDDQEDIIKWISAGFYAAGTDTTAAVMSIFFWVMTQYPDVQRRAQEELDGLLENKRLPTVEDQHLLPYVCAVIKEVHRWCPAGPLALPHRVTQDDEYKGYWIPEGTMIITNRWAMLHDPNIYTDPSAFRPERFLNSQSAQAEPDPEPSVFGFGRRSCMGVHIATTSIFLQVSSILATFNIGKPVNEHGNNESENIQFSTGIVAHPSPFKCSITPRSNVAKELIEHSTE